MLQRILDVSGIDMNNPKIVSELENDLERMDKLQHKSAPESAKFYKVIVEPSIQTYSFFHRFRFTIQYGKMEGNLFVQLGESIQTQTEALPFL